jgi:hypothetical protein
MCHWHFHEFRVNNANRVWQTLGTFRYNTHVVGIVKSGGGSRGISRNPPKAREKVRSDIFTGEISGSIGRCCNCDVNALTSRLG